MSTQVAPKAYWTRKRKDTVFIIGMLTWAVAHFLVFWLYINASSIVMTFQKFNTATGKMEWYGFERYIYIFKDMFLGQNITLRNSLINSLLIFPVSNFIILPLSFLFAYFLFKKVPMSGFFRIIFFLPSILSIVVLVMSFKYMFHSEFGPFNMLISKVIGETPDWFSMMSPTAMPMVFVFCIWSGLGYMIILLNGAIARIPSEILESGKIDGVGPVKELLFIVVPLSWSTISTLFILGTLSIFGFFLQPMLLISKEGGILGNTSTIALQVTYLVRTQASNEAAAIGLVFSIIGMPFVFFIKWVMTKIYADVEF